MSTPVSRQAGQARFWKKFLRLTRGRVSVLRALEVITVEEQDPAFKELVLDIKAAMDKGSTLYEAMQKHTDQFSPSVCLLIKTAEQSGAWDEILQEITEGLQDGTFD